MIENQSNQSLPTSKFTKVLKWTFALACKIRTTAISRGSKIKISWILILYSPTNKTLARSLNTTPSQSQHQPKFKRKMMARKMTVVKKRATSIRHGINRKLLRCGTPTWSSKTTNECNRKIRCEEAILKM